MSKFTFIIAALASLAANAASAEKLHKVEYAAIEEKNLGTKAKVDPAKGYIYMHYAARAQGVFVKTPSDADRTAFQAEWQREFDEAKKDYPGKLKKWQRYADYAKRNNLPNSEKPPTEPVAETFSIGDINETMMAAYGPMFAFSKGEDHFDYLVEVEPGTYTYYGPAFISPGVAPVGTCMCMGSVKFDVRQGEITNLGDFLALTWTTPEQGKAAAVDWARTDDPKPTDYALPASLATFPNRVAELSAAGKIDNYYGILIGRMPPVPGVLAYERDKVIDLKAQADRP